jgi:hypothetical protein
LSYNLQPHLLPAIPVETATQAPCHFLLLLFLQLQLHLLCFPLLFLLLLLERP